MLLGHRLSTGEVDVRGGDELDGLQSGEGFEVRPHNRAAADDAHVQRLAHSMPRSMMVRTCGSFRISTRWPGVQTKIRPWPHCRVHIAGEQTGRVHGSHSRTACVVVARTSM